MRRHDFEQFKKNTDIGLISDCVYYAWQNHQISDNEYYHLDTFLCILYFLSRSSTLIEYDNLGGDNNVSKN